MCDLMCEVRMENGEEEEVRYANRRLKDGGGGMREQLTEAITSLAR